MPNLYQTVWTARYVCVTVDLLLLPFKCSCMHCCFFRVCISQNVVLWGENEGGSLVLAQAFQRYEIFVRRVNKCTFYWVALSTKWIHVTLLSTFVGEILNFRHPFLNPSGTPYLFILDAWSILYSLDTCCRIRTMDRNFIVIRTVHLWIIYCC